MTALPEVDIVKVMRRLGVTISTLAIGLLAGCSPGGATSTPLVSGTPALPPTFAATPSAVPSPLLPINAPTPSAKAVVWKSLAHVETDPVYATLLRVRPQLDGSSLLTVDPVSPDTEGVVQSDCFAYEWTIPAGNFCPMNVAAKGRKVSLLPNSEATILGKSMAVERLVDFVGTYGDFNRDALLRLTLDADRHVVAIDIVAPGIDRQSAGNEPQPAESSDEDWVDPNYVPPEPSIPTDSLVTVPNFVGEGNKNAEQTAARVGLRLWVVGYTTGDPSLAAMSRGQCQVAQQGIPFGSAVERGTQVQVRLACPQTGYDPGGSMGYTGPAPPESWTGG